MELPQDDWMLFSFVNMKLRDEYESLDALCEDYGVARSEIEARLGTLGYEYCETQNAFR